MAGVVYWHTRSSERESAVTLANLQMQSILYGIDKELFEVEKETAMAVTEVSGHIAEPDSMMGIVERLVTANNHIMGGSVAIEPNFYPQYGPYMEYVSIEQDGNVSKKHLGASARYDYTSMEWYASAKEKGVGIWSEPYYDDGGGNRMMTTFSIPIFDKNKFIGVVTADISLEDFVGRIEALRPYPDSYTVVASRSGSILSHPDSLVVLHQTLQQRGQILGSPELNKIAEAALSGESGTGHLNLDGIEKFVCYSQLDRPGWSVMHVSPYRDILDSLGNSLIWIMSLLFVALLILGIVVYRIIKNTTKPVEELTAAAYRISDGDFNAKLPEIRHDDEIGRLRKAFAHMQVSLDEYIERLTETTREKQRIESELSIARQIQMNLVPRTFSPFAEHDNLELFAILHPAKEVGGDFYDFFFKEDKLVFAIGDVSGKGVPAALVMSVTRTLFRVNGEKCCSAADMVNGINEVLTVDNDSNMFVTLFVGIYDLSTGELDFCNAGHDYPMIVSPNDVSTLKTDSNIPVGIMPGYKFIGSNYKLDIGGTLLLYTDGVIEAVNSDNVQFGENRLAEIAKSNADLPPIDMLTEIQNRLDEFENTGTQFDDITLLAFRQKSAHDTKTKELVINNNLNEISKIPEFLEVFISENNLDAGLLFNLNLIIEEAVVNTISYGYPDHRKDTIRIIATPEMGAVAIKIIDAANPFNPLESEAVDISSDISDRGIGGLGIHLIKNLSSEIEYKYTGNNNILILRICNHECCN